MPGKLSVPAGAQPWLKRIATKQRFMFSHIPVIPSVERVAESEFEGLHHLNR